MKIKAYPLHDRAADIQPSPNERDWVQEGGLEGADLALESVNDVGWDFVCPCAFEATWNGGPSADDIEIRLEGGDQPAADVPQNVGLHPFVQSQLGEGRLTFYPGYQFQTEGEHALWVRGPVNRPKDGLLPLTSFVKASTLPCAIPVRWQFTCPNRTVRFEAGEPFATLLPYPKGDDRTVVETATIQAPALPSYARQRTPPRQNRCAYSVIVPTLDEGANLWFTLHGFQMMWDAQGDEDHELIVVDSGSTDKTIEFLNSRAMRKYVRLVETDASGPGPVRQAGADVANGEVLFFMDAHVLVPPTFFPQALAAIQRPEVWERLGSMHFPIHWDWGRPASTHYKLTLESNFWGGHGIAQFEDTTEIAAAGHGAVAVRREHFEAVGGYSAAQLQYGGDECYLDLKFSRFGYRNYLCPDTYVLHCSQRRPAHAVSQGTLFRNNVISAYCVGGTYWARKVLDSHMEEGKMSGDTLHRQYVEGIRMARQDHDVIQANAAYTLEQVLRDFKERGVPH